MKKIILIIGLLTIIVSGCNSTSVPKKKATQTYRYDSSRFKKQADGAYTKRVETRSSELWVSLLEWNNSRIKVNSKEVRYYNDRIEVHADLKDGKGKVIQKLKFYYSLYNEAQLETWLLPDAAEIIEEVYMDPDGTVNRITKALPGKRKDQKTMSSTYFRKDGTKSSFFQYSKDGKDIIFFETYYVNGDIERVETPQGSKERKTILKYGTDKEYYYLKSETKEEKYLVNGDTHYRVLEKTFRWKNGNIYFVNKFKYFDNNIWYKNGKYLKEEYNSKGQLAWTGLYLKGSEGERDTTFYYYDKNGNLTNKVLTNERYNLKGQLKNKIRVSTLYENNIVKKKSNETFDDSGELISFVMLEYDNEGNEIKKSETILKDKGNKIERKFYEFGKLLYLENESKDNNRIKYYEKIDNKGNIIEYADNYIFDEKGKVIGETWHNPDKTLKYTRKMKDGKDYYYDIKNQLVKIEEDNGKKTKLFSNGKLKAYIEDKVKKIEYDENGMVLSTVEYKYDGSELVSEKIMNAQGKVEKIIEYDSNRNLKLEVTYSDYVADHTFYIDEIKLLKDGKIYRKGKEAKAPEESDLYEVNPTGYEYETYENGVLSGYMFSAINPMNSMGLIFYDIDKNIVKQELYSVKYNGYAKGYEPNFSKLSRKFAEINYTDKENYIKRVFDTVDRVSSILYVENGEYVKEENFDENGMLTSITTEFNGELPITSINYLDGIPESKLVLVYDYRGVPSTKEYYTLQNDLIRIEKSDEKMNKKIEYYENGNIVKEEERDYEGVIKKTTRYEYDNDGLLIDIKEE